MGFGLLVFGFGVLGFGFQVPGVALEFFFYEDWDAVCVGMSTEERKRTRLNEAQERIGTRIWKQTSGNKFSQSDKGGQQTCPREDT